MLRDVVFSVIAVLSVLALLLCIASVAATVWFDIQEKRRKR